MKTMPKQDAIKTAPESGCASGGTDTPPCSAAKLEPKTFASMDDSEKDNSALVENMNGDLNKKKELENINDVVSVFQNHIKQYV